MTRLSAPILTCTRTEHRFPCRLTALGTYSAAPTARSFEVTTTRYPAATLPESGSLPAGVKFTNNKNGDGDHCGHPILNANKTYTITLKAADAGGTVTEKLTLTPQEVGAPER